MFLKKMEGDNSNTVSRILSLIPSASFVALDTEFFCGRQTILPPFTSVEAFYDESAKAQAAQAVAQLGVTVAVPKSTTRDPFPNLGLPVLRDLTFHNFCFNTFISDPTIFTFDTIRFLRKNGFNLNAWADSAISLETHCDAVLGAVSDFWRRLTTSVDLFHGSRGINPAANAEKGDGIDAPAPTDGGKSQRQAISDASHLRESFLEATVASLKAKKPCPYLDNDSGPLAQIEVSVPSDTVKTYVEYFLHAIREEARAYDTGGLVEFFISIFPKALAPESLLDNYNELQLRDIEELTGCKSTLSPSTSKASNMVHLTICAFRYRDDAQMAAHAAVEKLIEEARGFRVFFELLQAYKVPLVCFSGMSDVFLVLRSVYGYAYVDTYQKFQSLCRHVLYSTYDLKLLIDLYPISNLITTRFSIRKRSLERVFSITGNKKSRHGQAHDAGYDSYMTAYAFAWIGMHILGDAEVVSLTSDETNLYKLGSFRPSLTSGVVLATLGHCRNRLYIYGNFSPLPIFSDVSAVGTSGTIGDDDFLVFALYPVKSYDRMVQAMEPFVEECKATYPQERPHIFVDRDNNYGRVFIRVNHPMAQKLLQNVRSSELKNHSSEYVDSSIAEIHTFEFLCSTTPTQK